MQVPYAKSDWVRAVRYISPEYRYNANGDTWSTTWADDDQVYAVADDGTGIDNSNNSNLAIFRIEGTPDQKQIALVNPMAEYGRSGQFEDVYTWKGNGLVSIDGVLYLGVSQHSQAGQYADHIQRTYDGSIVSSRDHGKTWSARPVVNKAMWRGNHFSTPFFVQYGKDYQGALDDYVYAVSANAWNNGNYMLLQRCPRGKIANLDAGDWQWYGNRFCKPSVPRDNPWSSDPWNAVPIFAHRGYTSMTGIQWVPFLERFVLAQWGYTSLDTHSVAAFDHTFLALYESPKPWGPWKLFHMEDEWGTALYNPSLPSKWFESGGNRLWLTYSGNFLGRDGDKAYCFTARKMELGV